jgi:hypothetical protein
MLALVCVLSNAPTPQDCSEKTATDTIKEAREFSTMQSCYMYAYYKTIPLVEQLGKDAYSKVRCKELREKEVFNGH